MTDDGGSEERAPAVRGRPRKLTPVVLQQLQQIVEAHPGDTLAELAARFQRATGVVIGVSMVRKGLKEMGFVRQVASKPAGYEPPAKPATYGYTDAHRLTPEGGYPSSLTEPEWELVSDIFETSGPGKPPIHPRRQMVEAMLYVVRGGISWRMLPTEFPPWHQVFKTFRRWSAQGRFETMYDRLRAMWREREGRGEEPTAAVIDTQAVKTSAQGGPKGYDGGKKVKGRKRHLLTDTLGLLLAVFIQTADIHDGTGAAVIVDAGMKKYPTLQTLYADSSYGGRAAKAIRAKHNISVEVVRHPANRLVGVRNLPQLSLPGLELSRRFVPLPKRWVVERTHAWNDRPRRLAKDHDRTILSASAWIWLAEAKMLARRLTWMPPVA